MCGILEDDMHDELKKLVMKNDSKIVLLVMDGLGGLPIEHGGPTELEAANTPNLDWLAAEGMVGLHIPIAPGITPGSGPAHLALFSYDPLKYEVGRGVLETVGIGFPIGPDDVAARGNFCTVDENGLIVDRRAGRIPTEECARLTEKLSKIELPGVETFVMPVKEHRFALVLRGKGLRPEIADTDPQKVGAAPLPAKALIPEAEETAELVNTWIEEAKKILKDEHPANMLTLRGFSKDPKLPQLQDIYGINPAAIATYPMYRGVAKLVGMDLLDAGKTWDDEVGALERHWDEYDFFFIHMKYTDSRGEDGNFSAKVKVIEEVDASIPRILKLEPDVLIVTGDHSTPAKLKSHSWHPVPVLFWGDTVRPDDVKSFGERACVHGGLGTVPAVTLLPWAMAHAQRLEKFGA